MAASAGAAAEAVGVPEVVLIVCPLGVTATGAVAGAGVTAGDGVTLGETTLVGTLCAGVTAGVELGGV